MSATIVKLPVARRYRVWCEDCQDGYQGGRGAASKWMEWHNRNRHKA